MSDQEHGATAPSAPTPKLAAALTLVPKPTGSGPAHARDPRADDNVGTSVSVPRAQLFDILTQLKQLAPCHKDPFRFHERKDELVARLHHLATAS